MTRAPLFTLSNAQVRRLFVNFFLARDDDDDIDTEDETASSARSGGGGSAMCSGTACADGGSRSSQGGTLSPEGSVSDVAASSADGSVHGSVSSSTTGGPPSQSAAGGPLAAATAGGVSAEEVEALAVRFAEVAGNGTFRMADIQGHLLDFRTDPRAALDAVSRLGKPRKLGAGKGSSEATRESQASSARPSCTADDAAEREAESTGAFPPPKSAAAAAAAVATAAASSAGAAAAAVGEGGPAELSLTPSTGKGEPQLGCHASVRRSAGTSSAFSLVRSRSADCSSGKGAAVPLASDVSALSTTAVARHHQRHQLVTPRAAAPAVEGLSTAMLLVARALSEQSTGAAAGTGDLSSALVPVEICEMMISREQKTAALAAVVPTMAAKTFGDSTHQGTPLAALERVTPRCCAVGGR